MTGMEPRDPGDSVGFDRIAGVIKSADALGQGIANFAHDLSTDSRSALLSVNPSIIETQLAEEWPLAQEFSIQQILLSETAQKLKNYGSMAMAAAVQKRSEIPLPFTSSKHYDTALAEAYGSDESADPRLIFIADLAAWADDMGRRGWPVYVRIGLQESHRAAVDVYQGREETRQYLEGFSDDSGLDEELKSLGAKPDVWVSGRVLVSGYEKLDAAA